MQLFKKSMPLSKRKLLWEIKLKREEVCRNVLSRLNLGCHPRVSDPSSLCQREEVHKLPVSRVSFPGNVEPVRYEHSQNLSSLRAPYDQDTQQNTRPPFMPFEVKPFQRSFSPLPFLHFKRIVSRALFLCNYPCHCYLWWFFWLENKSLRENGWWAVLKSNMQAVLRSHSSGSI